MKVRIVRLIAIGLLAGALGGCQTGSIDTTMTSAFQANAQESLADRKIETGQKQFAAGNYGLAEKNFRAAVEATPDNGTAWLGLAASYDQLGRFEALAVVHLEQAAGPVAAEGALDHLQRFHLQHLEHIDIQVAQRVLAGVLALHRKAGRFVDDEVVGYHGGDLVPVARGGRGIELVDESVRLFRGHACSPGRVSIAFSFSPIRRVCDSYRF